MNNLSPLSYDNFISQLKSIPCVEKREDNEFFYEVVFHKNELPELLGVLSQFYKNPLKPPNAPVSFSVSSRVSRFGGIREEQTLFYREIDGTEFFSMLWPWGNQTNITLKTFQQKKLPDTWLQRSLNWIRNRAGAENS